MVSRARLTSARFFCWPATLAARAGPSRLREFPHLARAGPRYRATSTATSLPGLSRRARCHPIPSKFATTIRTAYGLRATDSYLEPTRTWSNRAALVVASAHRPPPEPQHAYQPHHRPPANFPVVAVRRPALRGIHALRKFPPVVHVGARRVFPVGGLRQFARNVA
jgi:hypothetical protein